MCVKYKTPISIHIISLSLKFKADMNSKCDRMRGTESCLG